jgi:hypothetical protein
MEDWQDWELDVSLPHLRKRMAERHFNEVDLRTMIEDATSFREDSEEGRYVIESRHSGETWEIIVEPQSMGQILLVVTAYRLG